MEGSPEARRSLIRKLPDHMQLKLQAEVLPGGAVGVDGGLALDGEGQAGADYRASQAIPPPRAAFLPAARQSTRRKVRDRRE
jgi:hypothetical protein